MCIRDRTHPFREGNTRSVIAFSVLLAAKLGIELDYELFAKHAAYVRNALVWCTQGIYSKYEYLENIYYDAAGLLNAGKPEQADKTRDYSAIGDYLSLIHILLITQLIIDHAPYRCISRPGNKSNDLNRVLSVEYIVDPITAADLYRIDLIPVSYTHLEIYQAGTKRVN